MFNCKLKGVISSFVSVHLGRSIMEKILNHWNIYKSNIIMIAFLYRRYQINIWVSRFETRLRSLKKVFEISNIDKVASVIMFRCITHDFCWYVLCLWGLCFLVYCIQRLSPTLCMKVLYITAVQVVSFFGQNLNSGKLLWSRRWNLLYLGTKFSKSHIYLQILDWFRTKEMGKFKNWTPKRTTPNVNDFELEMTYML